jgi:hypothetical protein
MIVLPSFYLLINLRFSDLFGSSNKQTESQNVVSTPETPKRTLNTSADLTGRKILEKHLTPVVEQSVKEEKQADFNEDEA